MANNLKKVYIGAICNRDAEILAEIKSFLLKNYNIALINFIKTGLDSFNVKYLEKRLKKYPVVFLIVKLTTQKENEIVYKTVKQVSPNLPILNSLDSVKICESRRATFHYIKENCTKVKIPKTYKTFREANSALTHGNEIIIKLDAHNIPNLPKNERIIGIAKNKDDFLPLINNYDESELFLQEYLGAHDIVNKAYVIGQWIVSITSHNRLHQNDNPSPLELMHIRTHIDEKYKRRILRIGRKLGMTIYGVDYINTKDGPFIVDINDFPSFRSIPEGISLIADHIYNIISMREPLIKRLIKVKL
ncbi:MAG: ATP-grasp domain-containing protein [Promethearchaeota archaeon]